MSRELELPEGESQETPVEIHTDYEVLEFPIVETRRPGSEGAEKWMGRVIPVLDHGFIYLVDYMGNDQSIEQAARVSYGSGTRQKSETEGLIRYLMSHRHTSPFEMGEMEFHISMPIFVARQWIRHRTASLNEESGRYSILKPNFYVPSAETIAPQSALNKQGRGDAVDPLYAQEVVERMNNHFQSSYQLYEWLLNEDTDGNANDSNIPGIAREIARTPLALSIYTQMYWKMDLHNLFHFLGLRMEQHAQWEIREYANAIGKIAEDSFPLSYKAFLDYQYNAVSVSSPDQDVLIELFRQTGVVCTADDIQRVAREKGMKSRERNELVEKASKLGIVQK
jgi:thymidylate synthase (FAD)